MVSVEGEKDQSNQFSDFHSDLLQIMSRAAVNKKEKVRT